MSSLKCNIAVVGVASRLPGGVSDCDSFWDLLINGVDGISEVPRNRWSHDRFRHDLRSAPGRSVTFSAGVVDDIDHFDCKFFDISEREAQAMDPQQRLALELTWEMFENANIRPSEFISTNTGVYMGSSSMDASLANSDDPWMTGPFSMTGNSLSIVSNRVSYFFDLQGPSLTIDTACSSSLVAIYEACKFLENDGGEYAVAGGVNTLYSPFAFIGFSKAQMLSEHGRCKVFDEDGNGYVRSEGGVIYLLKRLEDAERDGNHIHAVINAAGCNSDGMTRQGMSYPNVAGQKRLLAEIYDSDDVAPETLSYFEAHGTGTAAGDPVEITSIGSIIGSKRSPKSPLLVGSVKSSIGHLEPASGAAGMLKSILILKNKVVPPNIHLKNPLPTIDFAKFNLEPVVGATALPEVDGPARIGINSFGFGGTNAHVLLQEYEGKQLLSSEDDIVSLRNSPLFISARSEASLRALSGVYAEKITHSSERDFVQMAAGAAYLRELFEYKLVATGSKKEEIATSLKAFALNEVDGTDVIWGRSSKLKSKVAFVFSGNGAQWDGMGATLYKGNADFRKTIDKIDKILSPLLGWSLSDRMQQEEGQELHLTEISQPMLFSYQIGLIKALEAKGITPNMVYGHSVGEITAAYASGALDLQQVCELIYHRSAVQAKIRGLGSMAVANCSVEDALALPAVLSGAVEVAANNSPSFVTLSGDSGELKKMKPIMKKNGTIFRMLPLDYPFHSHHMEPFKEELFKRLEDITPCETSIPFISTVTSAVVDGTVLGARYWWRNIRERVDFYSATKCALELGADLFLEVGPNAVLTRFLSDSVKGAKGNAKVLPSLKAKHDSTADFEKVWKNAYVNGINLDYGKFYKEPDRRVELPLYCWDKVDVTLPNSSKSTGLLKTKPSHPLLGFRKDNGLYVWENTLDVALFPYLKDHVVFGDSILPGAAIIEMVLAAASEVFEQDGQEIFDLALLRPLPLAVSPALDVRCSISPEDGSFRLESKPLLSEEQWTLNAMGRVSLKGAPSTVASPADIKRLQEVGERVNVQKFYEEAKATGLDYGPVFRPLTSAWLKDRKGLAVLDGTPRINSDKILFDPCLLDGVFHVLLALVPTLSEDELSDVFLPAWFGRVTMTRPGIIKYGLASLDRLTSHSVVASFELMDEKGQVLGRMQECRFVRMKSRGAQNAQRAFSVDLVPINHRRRMPCPSFSANKKLIAGLSADFDKLASQYQRTTYYEEFRPLCQGAILSHLYSLLESLPIDQGFTVDQMKDVARIDEKMLPFVVYLLNFLESLGAARHKDGEWALEKKFDLPKAEVVWQSIVADYPAYLPEIVVLGRIGMHLANLVRGRLTLDEVLSYEPGGVLEAFYSQSPSICFQNALVVEIIKTLREQLPGGRPLRILEIGTGLGGLFNAVLRNVPSEQVEYTSTDKDEDLILRLKAANMNLQHVEFKYFDVEEQLPESLDAGCYDVVLAGHVLHELDNIGGALSNCRDLLAENGVLIALERNPDPLIDIFFGASADWWKHSSSLEDPVSRLLPMASWEPVFAEAGFIDFQLVQETSVDNPESYVLLAKKEAGVAKTSEEASFVENASRWVIFESAQPTPSGLAVREGLVARLGDGTVKDITCIGASAQNDVLEARSEVIDFREVAAWEKALQNLSGANTSKLKVILLVGFDTSVEPEGEDFAELTISRTTSVAMFARACENLNLSVDTYVVCGGALGGGNVALEAASSQAGAWGAARVVANEIPMVSPRMIDLHCEMPSEELLDDLVNEIMFPESMEVVLTEGQRLVPRLMPLDRLVFENDPNTEQLSRIALTFDSPGKLDNLYWKQGLDLAPEPNEVLIKVRASGLNFRDVMFSMGMLPAEALEDGLSGPVLGLECSGEVVGVGSNVSEFHVGDDVMCMSGPCFDSHVRAKSDYVFKKPEGLTFEEAATLPVAFATAYYSLKVLGNVQEGEKVLIHSAAGGVGLAAIQVAHYLGAEVYATSGSQEKREFLRLLGIKHVLNSRTLDFHDQIMELTNGEGMDVVLNSLAGEALFKSLKLLKPFGRFLELGKRDFYSNTPLRMRMLRKNITFFGIDLDEFMAYKPKASREVFKDIIALFESGEFKPLVYSSFNRSAAVDAFKTMQRGKHIGKLVVTFDELHHGVRTLPNHRYKKSIDASGTQLITGGLGGFGLATAKHLVENGARNIILLSRSGASSAEAKAGVTELLAKGANVVIVKADVSNSQELDAKLTEALKDMPPLKGVIHSAAVLQDSLLKNITPEQIRVSLQAKAIGAWNLHRFTKDMDLDSFVMYSSATTLLGNPGQANYVAANMVLEALAQHRRACDLPATTYGWGPISDTGMLTNAPEVMESLKKMTGVSELSSAQALNYMDISPEKQYANLFYFNLNWNRVRKLEYLNSTMFNWIEELNGVESARTKSDDSIKSILALDRASAIEVVMESVGIELASMLKIPYESLDTKVSIAELGLDSLMAVELGLLIEERFGVRVSSFAMNVNSDLLALSERVYEAILSGGETKDVTDVAKNIKEKHGFGIDEETLSKAVQAADGNH